MKVGDKIVCIDTFNYGMQLALTEGKVYKVIRLNIKICVLNDVGNDAYYRSDRFLTLREDRKKKIEKLNGI